MPEKSSIAPPFAPGAIKASCFSAVIPVSGWNQWVKCVAPFSIAHSFIAAATGVAMCLASGAPRFIVSFNAA